LAWASPTLASVESVLEVSPPFGPMLSRPLTLDTSSRQIAHLSDNSSNIPSGRPFSPGRPSSFWALKQEAVS